MAKLGTGHTPSRSVEEYWLDCSIPWLTLADVGPLRSGTVQVVTGTREKVSALGIANSSAVIHPAGTVALSRTASVGYSCILGIAMATSQDYVTWTCGPKLLNRYLLWVLRAEREAIIGRMIGSTHKTIYMPDIEELDTPVPPLAEQRAIADYLDAETARIDALIAKKQQLIHLLDERVNSLILRGVSGGLTSADSASKESGLDWLGLIPAHFGTPTLGANFTAQLGKMLNADAAAGAEQHPYMKNTNVKWDHLDLADLPTMTFEAGDRARCELRVGDLLVCEGGEVGRAAIWPGSDTPIYFQKALHRVRPLTDGSTRFLMYCLWAAASLGVFSVEGNQSTIVHLTGEKLREHRFPWPPGSEQEEIVRRVDEGRDRISALKQRVVTQIGLLAEHRQALITAAVTGEFAVPGTA